MERKEKESCCLSYEFGAGLNIWNGQSDFIQKCPPDDRYEMLVSLTNKGSETNRQGMMPNKS